MISKPENILNFLKQQKNQTLLAVFPHDDDISFVAGGLFQALQKLDIETGVICLNKPANTSELEESGRILGLDKIINFNLEPGQLKSNAKAWKKRLKEEIKRSNASLILTFDPHGITGNLDHIVTSLEVLELLKGEMKDKVKLIWRVADRQERKYFDKGHGVHINIDPTHYLSLGLSESIKKLKAIYSFKNKMKSLIFRLQVAEWYLLDHKELYYLVDYSKDKYNLLYS